MRGFNFTDYVSNWVRFSSGCSVQAKYCQKHRDVLCLEYSKEIQSMGALRSSLKEIVELTLTDPERRTLWTRFYAGHLILGDREPRPGEVDEIGQPILKRWEWGKDDADTEHMARIMEAMHDLRRSGNDSEEHVLRVSRETIGYIGSCVWMSLVFEDGMTSRDIFATNAEDHEGVAVYMQLEAASRGPSPSA